MLACLLLSACGASAARSPGQGIPRVLLQEARPIGVGPRFHPPASGPLFGRCTAALGSRIAVHLEVFASDRVVLVPAGIGTRPPVSTVDGRIAHATCYGALVTLDTTGVVLVTAGTQATLAHLFRSWGQRLSRTRMLSFSSSPGHAVLAFVDGRRWNAAPGAVPLHSHAEIVLEVGPYVRPHTSYTFPP